MAKDNRDNKDNNPAVNNPKDSTPGLSKGFGNAEVKDVANAEPRNTSNPELEAATKQVEDIKQAEAEKVLAPEYLSPESFEKNRAKSKKDLERVVDKDTFAFKAGIDPKTGRRFFKVHGKADIEHVYRAALMKKGVKQYYFVGTAYDQLFKMNDAKTLTVQAILYTPKTKTKEARYEMTVLSKTEISGPVAIPAIDGKKLLNRVKAYGIDLALLV